MKRFLTALLLSIAVASPAVPATLSDSRITESSYLTRSGYTGNDEPGPLFRVNLNTGQVLGTTKLSGVTLADPESADDAYNGAVWLADIGSNTAARTVLSLYVFAPDEAVVTPERYRFRYSDGKSHNAEALLLNPVTRNRYIISKEANGLLFRNDWGTLDQSTVGTFRLVGQKLPAYVTEAKFSPHARFVYARQKGHGSTVTVLDGDSFVTLGTFPVRSVMQPESLATDGVSVWVGSEGKKSPLNRETIPVKWQDAA